MSVASVSADGRARSSSEYWSTRPAPDRPRSPRCRSPPGADAIRGRARGASAAPWHRAWRPATAAPRVCRVRSTSRRSRWMAAAPGRRARARRTTARAAAPARTPAAPARQSATRARCVRGIAARRDRARAGPHRLPRHALQGDAACPSRAESAAGRQRGQLAERRETPSLQNVERLSGLADLLYGTRTSRISTDASPDARDADESRRAPAAAPRGARAPALTRYRRSRPSAPDAPTTAASRRSGSRAIATRDRGSVRDADRCSASAISSPIVCGSPSSCPNPPTSSTTQSCRSAAAAAKTLSPRRPPHQACEAIEGTHRAATWPHVSSSPRRLAAWCQSLQQARAIRSSRPARARTAPPACHRPARSRPGRPGSSPASRSSRRPNCAPGVRPPPAAPPSGCLRSPAPDETRS